jgi:hypothetical protein
MKLISKISILLILAGCGPVKTGTIPTGSWMPLKNDFYYYDVIQIEPRPGYYLIAARDTSLSTDTGSSSIVMFFIGKRHFKYISLKPYPLHAEDEYINRFLTNEIRIYPDRHLNSLYLLNTVYVPSKERIFRIEDGRIRILGE